MFTPVPIGALELGIRQTLVCIAGPCVIESEEHAMSMARAVRDASVRTGIPCIFKASFDKANRTSAESYRGPGLVEGLRILAAVKADSGLPVLTDIHEAAQAEPAARVVDVLQIPAFLCRQTDLLLAAGHTGCAVNIKKGPFLAPPDVRYAIDKVTRTGNERVFVTERGTTFGYHNLVVDMRCFPQLRALGRPVVFDATHSVQLPGGGQGQSGGEVQFVPTLAAAAVAAGVDGVFFEVHDDPASARSDGANALPLEMLEPLLRRLSRLHACAQEPGS